MSKNTSNKVTSLIKGGAIGEGSIKKKYNKYYPKNIVKLRKEERKKTREKKRRERERRQTEMLSRVPNESNIEIGAESNSETTNDPLALLREGLSEPQIPFFVRTLNNYDRRQPSELDFNENDIIHITRIDDNDYYYGQIRYLNGQSRSGLVKKNMVTIILHQAAPPPGFPTSSRQSPNSPRRRQVRFSNSFVGKRTKKKRRKRKKNNQSKKKHKKLIKRKRSKKV